MIQQQQINVTTLENDSIKKNNHNKNEFKETEVTESDDDSINMQDLANFFEHGSIIASYSNDNDDESTVDTVNSTLSSDDDDDYDDYESTSSNYDDIWSMSSCTSFSTFDSIFDEDDDEFATHHSSFNYSSSYIDEEEIQFNKRKVRFSTVTIREYGVTVGAITSSKDTCPLTLTWEHAPKDITTKLDCCSPYFYNDDTTTVLSYNNNYRNSRWVPPKRLSIEQRRERIARVQGLTHQQVQQLEYEHTMLMLHDSMSNLLSSFKNNDYYNVNNTTINQIVVKNKEKDFIMKKNNDKSYSVESSNNKFEINNSAKPGKIVKFRKIYS